MPFRALTEDASAPSSGFRVLAKRIPTLGSFALGASRELTSPYRAVRGLLGVEPFENDLRREALAAEAARQHPIATGVGTAAGFIPSLLLGGAITKPLRALPLLQRLASAGRLGQLSASALELGAAGGAAELIQGRPERVPETAAFFAAGAPAGLVGGKGFRALAKRAVAGGVPTGLTAAALAPQGNRLQAGAFGTVAGGVGGAMTPPFRLPAPTTPRPSGGLPPESWLIGAREAFPEEFTPQAAEQAARAGAEEIG